METPIVRADIMYYDNIYPRNLPESVVAVLEKYGFFPPEKIYADRLTRGRYVNYKTEMREMFIRAYTEKDVFEVAMGDGDSSKVKDYWHFTWGFTFYKNSKLPVEPVFQPWNVLSIDSTYGRLRNPEAYDNYLKCIKEIIGILKPFYASIDDVSNSIYLMKKAHESHFKPEYIQQIYWGNYFGEGHCNRYGMEKILHIPARQIEKINGGVLFTLTDRIFSYNSGECIKARKAVQKYLNLCFDPNQSDHIL